jgi:hypothetical protein
LESASLAGLDGVGDTGDLIGITTASFSTTMATYPTAEFSLIAITSTLPEADSIVAVGFMEETFTAASRSMDSPHRMPSLAPIPVPSAVLITAA